MKLYCNCLNICIETFGNLVPENTIEEKTYPSELMGKEVAEVEVIKITLKLPNLLKEKCYGTWRIYTCINCGLNVYASNKEVDNPVVVTRKLISDPAEISELSLSEHFSPAFKIILKPDGNITEDMYEHRLNEIAAKWLREEAQLVEERIKNYTEQQYAELETLRLRALRDDLIISRIIFAAREKDKVTNPKVPKDEINPSPRKLIKSQSVREEMYYDGGDSIIFPLDDFEHPLFVKDYGDTTSDATEDEEENAKVVQNRKYSAAHLARSLPIPVPQYMNDLAYDAKSNGSPPVPSDIAASIRALAKSVHGDSVFGELPRPRCRNHL